MIRADSSPSGPPFLAGLDDDQRRAVLHDAGPLIVLAGPGAGKTRVIIHRIARLLAPADIGGAAAAPESVLALAFTNKSAQEMRSRLAAMIGPALAERVRLSTSHAFGRGVLRRFGDRLGLPADHEIMDSAQRKRLIRRLILDLGLFRSRAGERIMDLADECCGFIDECRCHAVSPTRFADSVARRRAALEQSSADPPDPLAADAERVRLAEDEDRASLFAAYEREIIGRGLLCFDDDIWLPLRLLRERADVAAILRDECRHIVVDEFQDWNPAQIELLSALAPPARPGRAGPDVCVVGDDDQSIYGFRGADDRAFQRFADVHKENHTKVELRTNYRSAPPIIAAANAVISRCTTRFAPDKRSVPSPDWAPEDAGASASVEAVVGGEYRGLARSVAAIIEQDRRDTPDRPLHRYAVLCRTHTDLERVADELRLRGLPVASPVRETPYDDDAVQDVLAWLRLASGAGAVADAKRAILRPPFAADAERLADAEARFSGQARGDVSPGARSPGAFLRWLAAQPLEPDAARAADASVLLAAFAAENAASPVDVTIERIIRDLALGAGVGVDTRARARRVRALVRLVSFARSVAPRLARDEHPNAAAFLRYLDDLSDAERSSLASRRDEGEPEAHELLEGQIQVLTAHAAKGLEFDTVFVVRVTSPNGFPNNRGGADDAFTLDATLTGRAPSIRVEEERRLFFVACTRAKRRLILLREGKIDSGKNVVNFVAELRDAGEVVGLRISDPPAGAEDDTDTGDSASPSRENVSRWADREMLHVRRAAGAALFDAAKADLTVPEVERLAAALGDAARRLAMLAHLRANAGGADPAFLHHVDGEHAAFREYADTARTIASAAGPIIAPPRPPLDLSYYQVDTYESCPACYYHRYVLRLEERPAPDVAFGSAVHSALKRHLDQTRDAEAVGDAPPTLESLLALGRERLRAQIPAADDADFSSRMTAQLTAAHRLRDTGANILETEHRFRFRFALGEHTHVITGSIDRIEQRADKAYRVIDYKTGAATKRRTNPERDDLQLGIYTLALATIYPVGDHPDPGLIPAEGDIADRIPTGEAVYWLLSTGEVGAIPLSEIRTDKIRARIADAARGILAGRFDRNESACKGICRILGV